MIKWFKNITVFALVLSLIVSEFAAVNTQELILRRRRFATTTNAATKTMLDFNNGEKKKSLNASLIFRKAQRAAFKGGFYGAIAGGFQVLSLMWLRTIINYQYRYGCSLTEAFHVLYSQGGIKRFYKGLSYALIQNPLSKFGSAAANEASRVLIDQSIPFSPFYTSAVGTLLSILWRVFIVPLETCKTVLQVDGSKGFEKLINKLKEGKFSLLYEGTSATIGSTLLSHYPWFLVYHWLEKMLPEFSDNPSYTILRHGSIGFVATAFSDTVSNFLRIVKTMKQSLAATEQAAVSYEEIIYQLYRSGGIRSLCTRGLGTRIVANGLQNFIFTIVWRLLPHYIESRKVARSDADVEIER